MQGKSRCQVVSVEITSKGRLNLHKFDEKLRAQLEGYLVQLGNTPGVAFHGPFSEDFAWVHLEDWLHGPIRLTDAQTRVFKALWEHRGRAQSSEFIMRAAGLDSEKPMDVFKVKAANRGDSVYEGPLQAYEQLVRRQRRLGLYQLIWAGACL